MLTEIKTVDDLTKLPLRLFRAIKSVAYNPRSMRHVATKNKVARKHEIQCAVTEALKDRAISRELAVTILVENNAYGRAGVAAVNAGMEDK